MRNDDELEELLRETFRSREALVDSARVVPAGHRRRWVPAVAAAAVVLALAGGASYVVGREGPPAPMPRPSGAATTAVDPTPTAPSRTYAQNRAVALAEAKRVVRLVPLPAGAARADLADWGDSGFGMAPSDPALRQVLVWSVSAEAHRVGNHLRSHDLAGAPPGEESGGSSLGGPWAAMLEYDVPSPRPDVMRDTAVVVQWRQDGARTLVRADTFTAARTVRSPESQVPDGVTSVDVRANRHHTVLRAPRDAAAIDELVAAVAVLPGSIRPDQVVSCPVALPPLPTTTLTFTAPGGVVRFHLVDFCLGQVEVSRDGVRLSGTLDPGTLTHDVRRLLR